MSTLDPRLNAIRPDLADASLEGLVDAQRFAQAERMQVMVPVASVRKAPRAAAMQLTQALMGERVKLFERKDGWSWVQLERDGYVGYVETAMLSGQIGTPTHRVAVPSTFIYPEASIKSQPAVLLTMNAQVAVTGADEKFARLTTGQFVHAEHLKPVAGGEHDFVTVAEMFRHVPYYWGGKSVLGLDCSGLVQLALEACGYPAPRDSDMQAETLGTKLLVNDLDGLRRGDLVCWAGHIGIMCDAVTLLHANGHHMMVVAEPLKEAVDRIARRYGHITAIRRL